MNFCLVNINRKNLVIVLIRVNFKISSAKILVLKLTNKQEIYLVNLVSRKGEILPNKIVEQLRINLILRCKMRNER